RHQEYSRPDALPDTTADPAALSAADDRLRFRRPHQDHLLGPDRAGLRRRALSDPAQGDAGRLATGPARNPAYPRLFALYAARFRHLALFRNRQTNHRAWVRLHRLALGRQTKAAPGGSGPIRRVSRSAAAC